MTLCQAYLVLQNPEHWTGSSRKLSLDFTGNVLHFYNVFQWRGFEISLFNWCCVAKSDIFIISLIVFDVLQN